MNKKQTITINGVSYDAHTGMRVEATPHTATTDSVVKTVTAKHHTSVAANSLHGSKTTRSKTLSRRYVKSPLAKAPVVRKKPVVVHGAKSPMVTKFAPVQPAQPKKAPKPAATDIGPVAHPAVIKHQARKEPTVHTVTHPAATQKPQTTTQIKNQAIHTALERSVTQKKAPKTAKKRSKLLSIATASLAIMLLAGYLTYINMPSLSVRVAAAQAGIAATYPSYQPVGYSLSGPVAYQDGEVSMKFVSTTNPQNFTLSQSRSTWDSSALLENYVRQASNGKYDTYNDSGLTLYVYGTNAAWVNGGILHTITGDSQLSNDQIRHIATSM